MTEQEIIDTGKEKIDAALAGLSAETATMTDAIKAASHALLEHLVGTRGGMTVIDGASQPSGLAEDIPVEEPVEKPDSEKVAEVEDGNATTNYDPGF